MKATLLLSLLASCLVASYARYKSSDFTDAGKIKIPVLACNSTNSCINFVSTSNACMLMLILASVMTTLPTLGSVMTTAYTKK